MADVKWIKLSVDIFDNRKLKQIRKLPDGSNICLMWFMLMCLAGQINDYGQIYITPEVPFTDETLATEFDLPLQTVQLGLQVFQKFGMIEIVDDILRLSSWERYQNVEKLDKYREYQRNYHREYREKQKALKAPVNDDVNVYDNLRKFEVNAIEEDKEKEIDKELDLEKREETPIRAAADLYNQICLSFPKLTKLSDARKKSIKARLKTYTLEDFETLFKKAEASTFLKGGNGRNWQATFDWLISDRNMAKVLDGNYDDKIPAGNGGKIANTLKTDDKYDAEIEAWLSGNR